jgi:hypothetical protein
MDLLSEGVVNAMFWIRYVDDEERALHTLQRCESGSDAFFELLIPES